MSSSTTATTRTGGGGALVEPAEEHENPSSWTPYRDRPATPTANHGRHLGKFLVFTEYCSSQDRACLHAAHDDVFARVLEDLLDQRKAGDVADMRRVISTEFRMHRAGIDSDLQEHWQRVSAALDKFAEERGTDAAVMSQPLRFLCDGLMTLRLNMTKVNDRLCVLQEEQGRSSENAAATCGAVYQLDTSVNDLWTDLSDRTTRLHTGVTKLTGLANRLLATVKAGGDRSARSVDGLTTALFEFWRSATGEATDDELALPPPFRPRTSDRCFLPSAMSPVPKESDQPRLPGGCYEATSLSQQQHSMAGPDTHEWATLSASRRTKGPAITTATAALSERRLASAPANIPIIRSAAMKPPTFNGTNMAVRTFLSKFTACARANDWTDNISLAQPENQVTEHASVVFWNLGQAGGDYTFLEACAALESAYGTLGSREALLAELGSQRRKAGESLQTVGLDQQRLMCLVYPGARSKAVEEIRMRAFFDSLGDFELAAQCLYQAPKTLQEAIETAQRVEGCRLASEASERPARRTQFTSAGQETPSAPTTPFIPEDFVRACHAVAGAPAAPARIHAFSVRGCRL